MNLVSFWIVDARFSIVRFKRTCVVLACLAFRARPGISGFRPNADFAFPTIFGGRLFFSLLSPLVRLPVAPCRTAPGVSNCVVWNGVHHKTSPTGGFASFGYPDPGYFGRYVDFVCCFE